MTPLGLGRPKRLALIWAALPLMAIAASIPTASAQLGTLADPFPAPAKNAALNYQRALLHLASMDKDRMAALEAPVWEILPEPTDKTIPHQIANLLYRGRYAIHSATTGSRAEHCDFGIDFSERGAAQQLPHLEGMVQLGRMMTLRAALAESRGEWEEAAVIYFDALRIGRHMTHQNTLLEAIAGMEILRNNYVGLARWAVRCPSRPLVARAFGLMESVQRGLVDPSSVLSREASIMTMGFAQLRDEYPNGNWAARVLDSYDLPVSGAKKADRAAAKAACLERGVPEKAFESAAAFDQYLRRLEITGQRFVEAVAACVALPPKPRLERGRGLFNKYSQLVTILEADTLINPVETGALFAEHEAELAVTRVALALAASKQDEEYPETLDAVSGRFGGNVVANPYTGDPMKYRRSSDGKGFELTITADGRLPAIRFDTDRPIAAGKINHENVGAEK